MKKDKHLAAKIILFVGILALIIAASWIMETIDNLCIN